MIYFVTGGSRGVGAAIVLDAVRAGHDVAFTYVTNAGKAQEVVASCKDIDPERTVKAYALDVKDPAQVEKVGDQVLDDFETVHVIVNNAGINRDNLVAYMTDEEWFEVINTNLTGPFYVCRHFMPTLLGNKYGRIINISSLVADGGSGQANYAAAKAGLHGLTKTLAKEYGRKNITANALVPGFFDTDMTRETMPEQIKDFWKQYCPRPKGRMGHLSEISSVVNFLAGEGSGFINGQLIYLTGGLDWGP
jgi:NAD(P)-dependent dehydrogenase (short-subunit alcohol dehydrogenase family)